MDLNEKVTLELTAFALLKCKHFVYVNIVKNLNKRVKCEKGGQGRQQGGGQRARKHVSHYYVHGFAAGQGGLKSLKFSKTAPPKMLTLIQNQ